MLAVQWTMHFVQCKVKNVQFLVIFVQYQVIVIRFKVVFRLDFGKAVRYGEVCLTKHQQMSRNKPLFFNHLIRSPDPGHLMLFN